MATFTTFGAPKNAPEGKSKQNVLPESIVAPGSSKRNILRKGSRGGVTKGKTKLVEDEIASLGPSPALDHNDPLYDTVDDDDYILVSGEASYSGSPGRHNYDPEHRRIVLGPQMLLSEFKRRCISILDELFSSEDVGEAISSFKELNCPDWHYEIVKRAINLSMDRTERERELVSRLFSAAYPDLLSTDQLGKGFERIFEYMDELEIDAPGATGIVASFLARSLVDEILPPSFLIDPTVAGLGGEVVAQAKRVLSRDHQFSRVERIWGPGDGRPVSELKQLIDSLLIEYLVSTDLVEAERCVRELRAPLFHHEMVKRFMVIAADKDSEAQTSVASLMEHLVRVEVLSSGQLRKGLEKFHSIMDDIALDAPCAPQVLEFFRKYAEDKELLSSAPGFSG